MSAAATAARATVAQSCNAVLVEPHAQPAKMPPADPEKIARLLGRQVPSVIARERLVEPAHEHTPQNHRPPHRTSPLEQGKNVPDI
jgi:hypothetical protein